MGPESKDTYPYKRHTGNRYSEEKADMKTVTETGVMVVQAKESNADSHQKLEKTEDSPLEGVQFC